MPAATAGEEVVDGRSKDGLVRQRLGHDGSEFLIAFLSLTSVLPAPANPPRNTQI